MLLCPFTEEEPETLPRPWLLSFRQQGSVTVLFGVGRRGLTCCGGWIEFSIFWLKLTKFFCL